MNEVHVLRAGMLTTVQDRGRPGLAHLGIPPSGAADTEALELGNSIVGNDPDAAALEATLLGPALRFAQPALVAVTGDDAGATDLGPGARAWGGGRGTCRRRARAGPLPSRCPCLRLGARRVRRGGDARQPLTRSAHGPRAAAAPRRRRASGRGRARPARWLFPAAVLPPPREPTLSVLPGPRDDWFAPQALVALTEVVWRVGLASNRIGIRLEGPPLPRLDRGELLSEGLVTGAIQVPPSGHPIILGPDHPTTGGYPVIAVVVTADLPVAAQLAPGTTVRFWVLSEPDSA